MLRIFLGAALLLVSFLFGRQLLDNSPEQLTEDAFPHRRQLQRAAWNSSTWVILYIGDTPEEKAAYKRVLELLPQQRQRRTIIKVFDYDRVPDSLAQNYPLFIIGRELPPGLSSHLSQLPALAFPEGPPRLGEQWLDKDGDILQLTYLPSLHNDTLPMHLVWGSNATQIQNYLQTRMEQGIRSFLWSSWGYEVQRDGHTLVQGYFNDSTWQMDRQIHFDFPRTSDEVQENSAVKVQAYDGAGAIPEEWLRRLATDRAKVQEFTGSAELPQLDLRLYPSVERKALRTSSMAQAHLSDDGDAVHLVHNDNFQGLEWGMQYRVWLRDAFGRPAHPLYEEGLSFQWVDTLRGRPWRTWVRALAEADALPPFELLFDENKRREQSPVIGHLAAAAWVDYLLEQLGRDRFLEQYTGAPTAPPTAAEYVRWRRWLLAGYPSLQPASEAVPDRRLQGFTLAHEGYRIYNGYGSARAFASLRAMQQTGIEAIAVVPYSFIANANRPDPIPVARRAGSENDEATVFAHLSAQSLGQFTLLKPQIWMGGGSWPGDVDFKKEEDWQTFFTHYARWIHHYALLSEMYSFDALCIGTELRYTTLKQPEEWRKLIRSIRTIYHGPLTYAANWGEECEQLSFWPDLDFIGINCYYPLYKGDDPSDEDLRRGAEKVVRKMKTISTRADRPVWLTEIGYRSATQPWQQPHAEAGSRAIDEGAQARTYEAMLAACREEEWVQGFFWWKWPCDLDYDESRGRGYSPYGKAAEKVLSSFYLGH